MKTLKIFSFASLLICLSFASFAQKNVTETIPVAGNCGMCKTNIETAAKKAGAKKAEWNQETKQLNVTYAKSTNSTKIQEAIAAVGYDTRDVKATDAAYDKLHGCCKYDRAEAATILNGSKTAHCQANCDMKDGKCTNMEACKDKGCCKDEAACKEKGCCTKADGATTGHAADKKCDKDCCKKAS